MVKPVKTVNNGEVVKRNWLVATRLTERWRLKITENGEMVKG